MQISSGKGILPFFLVLFLIPTLGWGDCFNPTITKLANTTKELKAKVLTNKKIDADRCQLTLSFSGILISGEARPPLCNAKKDATVSVSIRTICCDTQPCGKGQKNKIVFSPWFPPVKPLTTETLSTRSKPQMRPAITKSAPKELSSKATTRAPVVTKTFPTTTAKVTLPTAPKFTEPETRAIESTSLQQRRPAAVTSAPAAAIPAPIPESKPAPQAELKIISKPETEERIVKNGVHPSAAGITANGNGAAHLAENGGGQLRSLAVTPASSPSSENPFEQYKVELGVTGEIYKPGPPGQLKVWIGDPSLSANFSEDMATAETTIVARAHFAKVTPNAPDFEVVPKESICIRIDPTGSEVPFAITPKHTGTFKVGASVLLYNTNKCDTAPVPKSAADLEVEVKVNPQGLLKYYLLQLWDILWKGVLNFWTWLVATIFGLAIFLIRKKLKKRFDYDAPDAGSPDN